MNEMTTTNYGFTDSKEISNTQVAREESRAMHEVQAAFVIAKKFPRNESECFSKIVKACERPFLADMALYAYPKGGKNVQGPSIRLAEMLVQYWGNCDAGIREISQSNGVSVAEAYAIDLETNTRVTKVFHVPHQIGTKQGIKKLTDPRDIYELVANQGARRMRACILAIIPGDIVDAAVVKCKHTMVHKGEPLADKLRKLSLAFEEIGVKVSHIEKKLGHSFDITTAEEVADLRIIYKSIKDGMATRTDFFDIGAPSEASKTVETLIHGKKDNIIDAFVEEVKEEVKNDMYDQVKKQLLKAKSMDTLQLAADLIRECPAEFHVELNEIYAKRQGEVK